MTASLFEETRPAGNNCLQSFIALFQGNCNGCNARRRSAQAASGVLVGFLLRRAMGRLRMVRNLLSVRIFLLVMKPFRRSALGKRLGNRRRTKRKT